MVRAGLRGIPVRRRGTGGFTLVEVLVAVTVTAILVTGVWTVTGSIVRTAARQKEASDREERLSQAIELLRQDWRGRLLLSRVEPPAPAGTRAFLVTSTADGVLPGLPRAAKRVVYTASDQGLVRREGGTAIRLLEVPARFEYWDGIAWRTEPDGAISALRLSVPSLGAPAILR
jgi:prepilin-type N-terminal cleavage/methylation domain-containing protein